jgi:hypothetical protein
MERLRHAAQDERSAGKSIMSISRGRLEAKEARLAAAGTNTKLSIGRPSVLISLLDGFSTVPAADQSKGFGPKGGISRRLAAACRQACRRRCR